MELVPLDECPKQILCVERFRNGKSWESAGAYDLMARILRTRPGADGCHTESDVIRRYQGVDELFAVVASERRLRRQRELNPRNFRELNGVYVHIGRHAEVIFAGGGFHRLAIAQLLGLESIPAQLGVVHEAALRQWKALYARG